MLSRLPWSVAPRGGRRLFANASVSSKPTFPPPASHSFSVFHNNNASASKLDKYRFTREIGRGTFAQVREAMDDTNRRSVAIKIMNKKQCGKAMCENEVRVLGELGKKVKHQRFTPVLDLFEDENNLYIVLELLRGGELFDLVLERGSLEEAEVAQICRKLLYALRTLHENGILHRDIKLENIMLIGAGDGTSHQQDFKLIDFGLALESQPKAAEEEDRAGLAEKPFVGTLGYCAPELLDPATRQYSTASDVWAVGVVCFILLSGSPPFAAGEQEGDEDQKGMTLEQKITAELAQIRATREPSEWRKLMNTPPWNSISQETKACVGKMLELDPIRRARIDEVLKDDFIKRFTQAADGEFEEFE